MLEEEAIQLTNKRFVPDVLANGRNKETTKQFLAWCALWLGWGACNHT